METEEKELPQLEDKQRRFCEEYVIDLNRTQAAIRAGYSENSAKEQGCRLLTKANVAAYVKHLQENISEAIGITAIKVANEFKKIAFANVADFKDGWYTVKDWDSLTDDLKAAISDVEQKVTTFGDDGTVEIIKFKLHDKQKALENLNKMLGFNAPEKKDITSGGKSISPMEWIDDD